MMIVTGKPFGGKYQQNQSSRTKPIQWASNAARASESETTQVIAQYCEWERVDKETPNSPFEVHDNSSAQTTNASVTQPASPWFSTENAERWKNPTDHND